jgi:nucleoside-diphosphate-sugar epimerase
LARIYGPTLRKTDTKALSQFIGNALKGQDIVLKSSGDQYFSYLHVADAVSGILTVLLKGDSGEAYNVADAASNIRLKDLAELIAKIAGRKVIFDLPDAVELAGFSTATKALMDNRKIMALGWKPRYDIETGISETLKSLKEEWS